MLHQAVIVNDAARGIENRKGIIRSVDSQDQRLVKVDVGGLVFETDETNVQPTDEQIEVQLVTPYKGAPYCEVVIPTSDEDWGDLMEAPESDQANQ